LKQKTRIADLKNLESQTVTVQGWVHLLRSSGQISFLILRDGSGFCQCIFSEKNSLKFFKDLTLESAVQISGKVKSWKNDFEIEVHSCNLISKSLSPYPIGKKSHGVDFLMNHRHLWLRSKRQRAIMSIRTELIKQVHNFFQKENFMHIDAPILTPNSCEGTTSLFEVNFFNQDQVYLSQSGQLYMEAAAAAYGKVYCFGPTFRAEKSSTRRHLLEFWMIEPEMAFYNYAEAMSLASDFLEYVIQNTLENKAQDFKTLERDLSPLQNIKKPFPQISYKEACDILQKHCKDFKPNKDLGGGEETIISAQFKKPVFIHHYPKNIKAFYMKEDPEDSNLSLSFDLLATEGYGEIVGGGEREDSLKILEHKIQEHQLEKQQFEWYLDLRRYGNFPHSGFGLGLERLVSWVCHLDHVRESIPFPRVYGRSFFE